METVRDFIFLGCKITADSDCSHETKRYLLLGTPGGGNCSPLQYSCLENLQGQGSLVGYSPWGCKELDTTERLSPSSLEEKLR